MFGLNQDGFLCENEYEIADEPLLASLFTTGNGYMGVRGSFEEYASQRIQGAFVRGYIDEIIEVCEPFADNEYMKKYYLDEEGLKRFERQESCVNMPDFLTVRMEIGDKVFFPWEGKIEAWSRYLDTKNAEFVRRVVWNDGSGNRTELEFTRSASFDCEHLYCQRVTVHPLNHNLPVTITSAIDTAVKTGGQFITETDDLQTNGDELFFAFHAVNKFKFKAAYLMQNRFPSGIRKEYRENGRFGISVLCEQADHYVFEKVTFIGTERDTSEPIGVWVKREAERQRRGYSELRKAHRAAYAEYFAPMDIQIENDAQADGYLRFASYHTAISAPRHDSIHGVAAKGLTGERYNQFVWWDCEIHQLPFFMLTAPQTAKNLLMYRWERLEQAKKNAAAAGYCGAKFAFCSSVTGEERVWEYVRHPFMQVHINSDIPLGILNYYACTQDREFLKEYGLKMIHECTRFWMSRVTFRRERYEILQVTGTDEHHPYVDNDAYTNYCVAFVLKKFLLLSREFGYALAEQEYNKIDDIARNLYLPCDKNGMIPQFDGYFSLSRGLEEAGKGTLKQFQMKKSGLYHKSQIIKQPDVVLLYTLADVGLERSHYAQNWDYYEKMCETSSSLTFPVHAIASAHNRRMLSFYQYFMNTLKIDIDDLHGVGWQGVHSGCLAGGYLSILYGVFGMRYGEGRLKFEPNPMPFWEKVSAKVRFCDRELLLVMQGEQMTIRLIRGEKIEITAAGQSVLLTDEFVFSAR